MIKINMLFVLLILVLGANEIHAIEQFVCENEDLYLLCPRSSIIHIYYANYGRHNITICSKNSTDLNVNCTFNATQILQQRCESNTRCSLNVSNDVFGDPCPGTYKYLELNYTCGPTMIPINPPCDGPNEEYRCENSCFRDYCAFQNIKLYHICRKKSCIVQCLCQKGYLRDQRTGRCIKPEYCPLPGPSCETHETFSECGAACQKTCSNPRPICNDICVPGYICADDYIRANFSRYCIHPFQC